jgi:hypothetical protein
MLSHRIVHCQHDARISQPNQSSPVIGTVRASVSQFSRGVMCVLYVSHGIT